MSSADSRADKVTLRLSCGCKIEVVDDPTTPQWEIGEATFCDDETHSLVDVEEVLYG